MSDLNMNFEKLNKACKEANETWREMMNENNPFDTISKIVRDIADKKDKEVALEFTKQICTLLKNKGVSPVMEEYIQDIAKENSIERKYGVAITGLDFTEHDKVFEDRIIELENIINHKLGGWDKYGIQYNEILDMKAENQELKKRIAELENKETVELPFDALETANMLINATYKAEIQFLEKQVDRDVYDIDDLEQIAEHLLVYCKHNRESEE